MSKKEVEYEHPEKKMFWVAGVSIIIMFVVPGVFALTFGALDWGGPVIGQYSQTISLGLLHR